MIIIDLLSVLQSKEIYFSKTRNEVNFGIFCQKIQIMVRINAIVLKFFLSVSLLLFLFLPTTTAAIDQMPGINQSGLNVSYNSTSLTLFPNQTAVVTANVSFEGTPVNDAFFYFDTLPEYDLGEAALLIGPGFYHILFRNYSNVDVPPENYSTNLVVESVQFNSTKSTPFTLNLIRTDFQAPNLTVYEPSGNGTYSSLLPVNFTASDNVGWRQMEIRFQGEVVFSRLYVGQDSLTENFFWNRTHIQIATFFRVFPIDGNSSITIKVWDTSFNLAEYKTETDEDLKAPTIEIVRPFDGEILENREVRLEWKVEDKSGVKSIEILINGILYQSVSPGSTAIDFVLPIDENEPRNLTLGLRATDQFNNSAMETIRIEYNPGKVFSSQGFVDLITRPNLSRETFTLILGVATVLFAVLLLVTYITVFRKSKTDTENEMENFKGNWSGNIPPPPFLQILKITNPINGSDFFNKMDVLYQLESEWNQLSNSLSEKRRLKLSFLNQEIKIFSVSMFEILSEVVPDQIPRIKPLLERWQSNFKTSAQPLQKHQIHSFKEAFPKEALKDLLETKGMWNERTERLLTLFEEEWNEGFAKLEKEASVYEILNFKAEFAAELYLSLLFISEFNEKLIPYFEKITRSLG